MKKQLEKNKGGRPVKVGLETFSEVVDKYLDTCKGSKGELVKAPKKQELAYLLGIDKSTISDYAKNTNYGKLIKKIELGNELFWLSRLESSKSDQNAMFGLKTQHGYVEAQYQKVDVNISGQIGVVQMPVKKRA